MLRFLALAGLLLATPSPQNDSTRRVFSPDTQADTRPDAPLSERRVSYDIDVTLDPEAKTVSGVERITWRNTGPQPVGELQFHMYLNAFKPGSTFMRESGGRHRGFEASSEDRWGGVELSSLRIVDAPLVPDGDLLGTPALDPITAGTELLDEARFIQPDDSNLSDETVLSVPLPEAVAPGETVTIEIDFVSTLPEIVARTGWATSSSGEPFFMVAQWFPKLGVYEIPGQRYVPADAETGRWSTHQFHANSEFYADFGTYRVRMTVPADYELGATGQQVSAEDLGEQRAETYWAADVHDFAWTTGANLLVFEDQWEDVQLRLLMQPEHEAQAQRHFDAAKIALDRFDAWYGEYPYPTLTLVDGVGGSNGMEYPTLITCGTVYMLPEWARPLELVTIHEFGHQYWYGLVASNEAEEAWLDEGINSYSEVKVMEEAYGRGSVIDFPGFKISDSDFQRLSYTEQNPTRGAIYARSWDYTTRGDFGRNSYAKPATVLLTLEGLIGEDTMREILRTYFERWRFNHPTTEDFKQVAEEIAGDRVDVDRFFEQFIYGTVAVDYRLQQLSSQSNDLSGFTTVVRIHRMEEGVLPQTLRVRFADGHEETRSWDGEAEWQTFTFRHGTQAIDAFIDPGDLIRMDLNRLNNRRAYDNADAAETKYAFKLLVWIQQVLSLV